MTKEEHIKIHKELHTSFDKLIADFIYQTDKSFSKTTVMDLIEWSDIQPTNHDVKLL